MVSLVLTAAAVVSALGVLALLGRRVWRWVRRASATVSAATDAILGRDAVLHPDTGAELAPATPGLGVRLASLEEAFVLMAQTQADVATVSRQVAELTEALHDHVRDPNAHRG